MREPGVDVVTLCEGHYERGLGALVNSLVATGFTGTVWVGTAGPPPSWLRSGRVRVSADVQVVALPTSTERHLTNHKAEFLCRVAGESAARGLLYLDPDIVVRQPWPFFVDWVDGGVAVCADVNPVFPATHPTRKAWLRVAAELGDDLGTPAVDLYVNGGLVGVTRARLGFVERWERYLVAMAERGPGLAHGPGSPTWDCSYRWSPFLAPDQDALNLAVMAHAHEVSLMGPQAMGLAPGWAVVTHAIGAPKPWRGSRLAGAARGRAPTRADADFVRHTAGPVRVYDRPGRALRRADLWAARAVALLTARGPA